MPLNILHNNVASSQLVVCRYGDVCLCICMCVQIVQHQKGKLAKFHTSKSDTKESATSLFSDRDFDRFEKEYVF